jgi:hypothetical protein
MRLNAGDGGTAPLAVAVGLKIGVAPASLMGAGPGIDLTVTAIRLTQLVVTCGGLSGVLVLPIYLGRPGTHSAPGGRYEYDRAAGTVALVLERPAVPRPDESRPAAESTVPASRAPSASANRESSRSATGASASTQRSASTSGPTLRTADSSDDPGKQR